MTRTHRLVALALAPVVPSLASCVPFSPEGGPWSGREPAPTRGCGECVEQVRQLERRLASVRGVAEVREVSFSQDFNDRGELSLGLDLQAEDLAGTDIRAETDRIARVAWRSRIDPLDALDVSVSLRSGYRDEAVYEFGVEPERYAAMFGPRPDGVPVPSVAPEGEVEGCGDCEEEARAVAVAAIDIPGVEAVLESDFVPDSPTNGNSLDVTVRADAVDAETVTDEIAELAWRSHVTPLDWISVGVVTDDDIVSTLLDVDPEGDEWAALEERWGPRPVE
ncbi:hypothetical protein DDE18_15310 [Nocardioides gansuensis]|uniref:HMA domain-containing protein n=1 Tax=Nocardioides gansuensis TaxID=2138300 RepID=A0A2T8F8K1_9ACTN|nr:hypothetical protein [Nocardioides gansuensis]PVG82052.1 hypothetical protein DDE18_15310 [Nocardioides gansuensis]